LQLSKIWKTSKEVRFITKGVIVVSTMLPLFSGCTINGKNISQIMDKNISNPPQKEISTDTNKAENNSSNSGFKINLKWANKEYHDGEEDIKFHIH